MLVVNDALDAILLGCFFFGLIFSAVALLLGLGHIGGHDGHVGHGGHGGDVGHGGDHGAHHGDELSFLNLPTLLGFIAWFGGVGYLARHGLGWYSAVSVVVGLAGGLVGGFIVYQILARLARFDGELHAEDFRLPGTIARVTYSIRAGGTGEIVYEQAGVRQVGAARAAAGQAIPRGTEVVVLRTANGIAFVEPWDALVAADHPDLLSDAAWDGTATAGTGSSVPAGSDPQRLHTT